MFIARRGSYLSAESIALMIAEEFLLAFILLLLAILFRIPELALAIGFCHTLHLLGHIMQVFRFRRWVPGGFTALTTFPILILSTSLSMSAVSFLVAASDSKRVSDGFSFGKSGFFT